MITKKIVLVVDFFESGRENFDLCREILKERCPVFVFRYLFQCLLNIPTVTVLQRAIFRKWPGQFPEGNFQEIALGEGNFLKLYLGEGNFQEIAPGQGNFLNLNLIKIPDLFENSPKFPLALRNFFGFREFLEYKKSKCN